MLVRFYHGSLHAHISDTRYAAYRWKAFVDAISAKYPHLEFIATTLPETALDPAYLRSTCDLQRGPMFRES